LLRPAVISQNRAQRHLGMEMAGHDAQELAEAFLGFPEIARPVQQLSQLKSGIDEIRPQLDGGIQFWIRTAGICTQIDKVFGAFMEHVTSDPELRPKFVAAATSFRANYTDPDCAVSLVTTVDPPVVKRGDAAKAEELMKGLTSDVEVRKDRIDIESRFPKRSESIGLWDILGRKVASLQINYYVQVPSETSLLLETSNGEVRAGGMNGRITATTTNGDIRVEEIKGNVFLITTNGEVHVTNVSGGVSARPTNGTIIAQVLKVPTEGEVKLETTNGNVQTYFPSDLKATVEATTTNGRVSTAYPITSQGVMTSKSIRGTINGGGAKISLATTNGNVEMRRLSERRRRQDAGGDDQQRRYL